MPNELVHIYCDESCHLESDGHKPMILGALACPANERMRIGRLLKQLRDAHGILGPREIKWTQVSPSRLSFYKALIDLFFSEPRLAFRTVVIPDKGALNHGAFGQDHDDFYFKMWWQLLTRMIDNDNRFRIFIDIKDTKSARKLRKLHEILANAHYDFDQTRIQSVEAVHSQDVPLLQLADLLIGAISHLHRNIVHSAAKQELITHLRTRSGLTLLRSTPPLARKMNVFVWRPQFFA